MSHWYGLALEALPRGERGALPTAEKASADHVRTLVRRIWHEFVETGDPKLLRLNKELTPYLLGTKPSASDLRAAWDHWAGVESAVLLSRQRVWPDPPSLVDELFRELQQRNPMAQRSLVALFLLEAFVGVRRAYRQSVGASYEAQLQALDGYLKLHRDGMRQVLQRVLKGASPEQGLWKRSKAIDAALSLGVQFVDPRIVFEPLSAKDVRDRLTKRGIPMPRHGFGETSVDILSCAEELGKRLSGLYDADLSVPQPPPDLTSEKAIRTMQHLCSQERYTDAEEIAQKLLDGGEPYGASSLAYVLAMQGKHDLAMAYWDERSRNASKVPEDYWNLALNQDDNAAIVTLALGLIHAPSYPCLLRLIDLSVRHRKPEASAYLMLLPVFESGLFSAALYQEQEAFIALDWMRRNGEPVLPNPAYKQSLTQIEETSKTLRLCGYPQALDFWLSCLREPSGESPGNEQNR